MVRLLSCAYLAYLVWTSHHEIGPLHLGLIISTVICLALTYYAILDRLAEEGADRVTALAHTLSSLCFFANAWNLAMYWNISDHSDRVLMRVCNAPAFSILLNFLMTDWLLLAKHSLMFVASFVIFELRNGPYTLQRFVNVAVLAICMHFTQYVLCYTQQTFRGRSVRAKIDIDKQVQKQVDAMARREQTDAKEMHRIKS